MLQFKFLKNSVIDGNSVVALRINRNMTLKGGVGVLIGVLLFSSVVAEFCLLFFEKMKSLSVECMWNFFFSQSDK